MDTSMPYRTIRELLDAAYQPANYIDKGQQAATYNFPKDASGMQNFVLRVFHETDFRHDLAASTHLTPVRFLVQGTNIGQPLLQLDKDTYVTILAKQKGDSLRQNYYKFLENYPPNDPDARCHAALDLVNRLLTLKTDLCSNPFTSIFIKAYQLGHLGYNTDYNLGNILLDENSSRGARLKLVDQLAWPIHDFMTNSGNAEHQVFESIKLLRQELNALPGPDTSPELKATFDTSMEQLTQLINAARDRTLHYGDDLLSTGARCIITDHGRFTVKPRGIYLSKVLDTSVIALESPPAALMVRLQQLGKEAEIKI